MWAPCGVWVNGMMWSHLDTRHPCGQGTPRSAQVETGHPNQQNPPCGQPHPGRSPFDRAPHHMLRDRATRRGGHSASELTGTSTISFLTNYRVIKWFKWYSSVSNSNSEIWPYMGLCVCYLYPPRYIYKLWNFHQWLKEGVIRLFRTFCDKCSSELVLQPMSNSNLEI